MSLAVVGLSWSCLYRKLNSAIMMMKSAEDTAMRPTCWMARWIGASLPGQMSFNSL